MLALITFFTLALVFYIGQRQKKELPPLPKQELVVDETDFWEEEVKPLLQSKGILKTNQAEQPPKKVNIQKLRKQQKDVKRRRKRRKLAKKSRQINRN